MTSVPPSPHAAPTHAALSWRRIGAPEAEAAVLIYAATAAATYLVKGRYDPWGIGVVAIGWILLLFLPPLPSAWRWLGPDLPTRLTRLLLLLAGPLCLLTGLLPQLSRVVKHRTAAGHSALLVASGLLLSVVLVQSWRGRLQPHKTVPLLGFIAVVLVVGRLLVPVFVPVPFIDSWTLQQEGADVLLAGGNPYTASYTQIYPADQYDYRSHFGYLPLVAVWDAVWRTLLQDIRFGYALADGMTAYLLGKLATGPTPTPERKLLGAALAVAFLARPMGGFVVHECWSEPLLLLTVTAALLALQRQLAVGTPGWRPGPAFGLALAAKQTNVLFLPLILTAPGRWRALLLAGGVAAATVLPFFLWDPQAFLKSTVFVFTDMRPRPDAFSLWTVAWRETGLQLPGLLAILATAAVWTLAWAWAWLGRPDRAVFATVLTYWTLFLTSRQSFANYHDYAQALLLVAVAFSVGLSAGPPSRPWTATPPIGK